MRRRLVLLAAIVLAGGVAALSASPAIKGRLQQTEPYRLLGQAKGKLVALVGGMGVTNRPAPYIANHVQHDYAQWKETGRVTPDIAEFVALQDRFQLLDQYAWAKIVPYERSRGFHYAPFFGYRFLLVEGAAGPEAIVSTNHPKCADMRCLGAVVPLDSLRAKAPRVVAESADGTMVAGLTGKGGWNSMFGLNSMDFDGDGRGDYLMDGRLALSSAAVPAGGPLDLDKAPSGFSGREVFVKLKGRAVLLSPEGDTLRFLEWDAAAKRPGERDRRVLPKAEGAFARAAAHVVLPLPDMDGDGEPDLLVRTADRLVLLMSGEGYDTAAPGSVAFDLPAQGSLYEHRIGAMGDFTGDGVPDFWYAVRGRAGHDGFAVLVDGARLKEAAARHGRLSEAVAFRIDRTPLVSGEDSIGSSLSYQAGDVDGDGLADFTIASHYELNMTGSFYVIPGALLAQKRAAGENTLDLMGCGVLRLRPALTGELTPPFYHHDDVDLNGDGRPDIVLAADNDGEAGPEAGALFVLDGAKIARGMDAARCGDNGEAPQ